MLRIQTTYTDEPTSTEKVTFKINKAGMVTLLWGTRKVVFHVH
jgi:hypothetical protein